VRSLRAARWPPEKIIHTFAGAANYQYDELHAWVTAVDRAPRAPRPARQSEGHVTRAPPNIMENQGQLLEVPYGGASIGGDVAHALPHGDIDAIRTSEPGRSSEATWSCRSPTGPESRRKLPRFDPIKDQRIHRRHDPESGSLRRVRDQIRVAQVAALMRSRNLNSIPPARRKSTDQ